MRRMCGTSALSITPALGEPVRIQHTSRRRSCNPIALNVARMAPRSTSSSPSGARERVPRPSTEDRMMIASTHEALDLVAAKWKVDTIYLLARGAHRYGELYAHLLGISKKML